MKKSSNTKRAFLASILSLLLCMAMLIGSTFAWFTDSVTTGKNTIVAGNLDVELYSRQLDETTGEYEYVPVSAKQSLFDNDALWEPGHTEVVYLKVANLGSLALKYKLAVTVDSETPGENVAGDTFKLSDYLVFGQASGDTETVYDTREQAWAAAGSTLGLDSYFNESVLYPAGTDGEASEEYVALVVYMPESVGNEANYKTGTDAPTITLGVTLVATQTPYESDSFDEKYDENASVTISTGEDLNTALKNGGNIVLAGDMTAQEYTDENESYTFINVKSPSNIDLNGNSLKSDWINIYDDITIENGTLVVADETFYVEGESKTVTLKNVTLTAAEGLVDGIVLLGDNGNATYILDGVTTEANISVNGAALVIDGGAYSGDVRGASEINGGTFGGDILVTETKINDGEISGTFTTNVNDFNLEINGGEFKKDALIDAMEKGSGTITISGGTFACTTISAGEDSFGNLNITGGTFTEDLTVDTTYASVISISGGEFKSLDLTGKAYSPITISGGTFGSFSAGTSVVKNLTITGGTFGTDPSTYLEEGYEAVENEDGTWTVKEK